MKALIFPGQGSQFPGMGKNLYDSLPEAKNLFEKANEILGFRITDIMFSGTEDDLKQTRVTQPAIFLHSVIQFLTRCTFQPEMTAGHSLGEFSALVANKSLSFENALSLVSKRANAMQRACEINPSTMAAVMGLDDSKVEEICATSGEIVVAANYNYPGQLVISGTKPGVEKVCELLKSAGAKRAILLPVGGAFHSPLMEPAKKELEQAIVNTEFGNPVCPVYQNATGLPEVSPVKIRENLILQLTSPVRWTQSVQNMVKDGATEFFECGPGKVLQGLVRKIHREAVVGEVL
ncbi:MAG: [acyl-carrier-protein] S-malonyltransferase [Bacteroidetes bacterium RIFCSPLOWO2_12_FULL_37_12]|nr:MAG: [acyl-carrier-protein] S-malonyltransferase [Bacteroidetes bacterium RIFCSPLOWO2_12_FULL_37_12]